MSERRFFTLDEANAMVPWLKQCFGRILQLRSQLRSHYQSLEQRGYRAGEPSRPAAADAGDEPSELATLKARVGGLMEALRAELDAITERGIEIKDPDQGLCDFWAVQDGREVYLCWRFGEDRIDFYHDPHAGFAGRKPIDKSSAKPRILH